MPRHALQHEPNLADSGERRVASLLSPGEREREASIAFARARVAAGLTQRQVASMAGRSHGAVPGWEDPLLSATPSLAVLFSLPARILERLAEERRAMEEPRPAPGLPMPLHALNVCTEAGDVANVTRTVFADGELSDGERARLLREIREARAALDAYEADVLATEAGR